MDRSHLLRLSLSLATLLYLRQIAFWTAPKNRYYFHWQRSDTAVLVAGVLAAAALFFGVAWLVRRLFPRQGGTVLRWLTVVLLADIVVGYGSSERAEGTNAVMAVGWAAMAGLGLYLTSGMVSRAREQGAKILAALVWLAPISLAQMLLWKPWNVRPTVEARTEARAHARQEPRTPVFIFVFDDWSFQRSYEGGELLPELRNLRRFAARSLEFTDAHSPSTKTTTSLPRFLFQARGELEIGNGAATWVLGDSAVPSTAVPSLLTAAGARGYKTSITGFYLPYRAILGEDEADVVTSGVHVPKGRTFPERFRIMALRNLDFLSDPLSQWLWMRWYARAYSENWARLNYDMRRDVTRLIRESSDSTFALVHWPLPHGPFVLNEDGSYRGPFKGKRMDGSPSEYRRHLRALDHTFGAIVAEMEAVGAFESALIVMTSDHSWKAEPEERYREQVGARTWVPLLVKLPHQRVSMRVTRPFCLSQLAAMLVWAVERPSSEVRDFSQVGAWSASTACASDSTSALLLLDLESTNASSDLP
jgi:hypothetical protein